MLHRRFGCFFWFLLASLPISSVLIAFPTIAQVTTTQVVSDQAVSDRVVSDPVASDQAVPDPVVSDQVVPDRVASDPIAPRTETPIDRGSASFQQSQPNALQTPDRLPTAVSSDVSGHLLSQVNPADIPPQRLDPRPVPQPELPETVPPQLPPPEELLPPPETAPPDQPTGEVPEKIFVQRFEIEGNTAFSDEQLAAELESRGYVNRDLTFAELLQARSVITQLYVDAGYVTSGALIPPQTLENGVVLIQVIEGRLETINVTGLERLNTSYVRSRLNLAAAQPLNVNQLLEGLQLLQLDPLIETISADLQAGVQPGTSILQVEVTEADTWSISPAIDNNRSPSVGSFRRQVEVRQANLTGLGDALSVNYSNTDGSNGIDASYTVPLNPRNGTLRLAYGFTSSNVIEAPFDALDISAESRYYELSYRQPLVLTPTEEFALGLTLSRQESQTELGLEDIGPFPLSPGADDEGRTRISALRFFQEWTKRDSRQVLAARSQLSLGVDLLDATVNEAAPDSRFFAWRGQGQWVRLLAPETLLLIRGDVQLADSALVPLEQFGVGGQESVRGYRQDALLTDNGAILSAEVRVPVLQVQEIDGVLQVVPFIDFGTTWNNEGPDPDPQTIAGTGLGLLWRMGDVLTVRLDWGIPLVDVEAEERTWQENGIYFSVRFSPSF